MDFISDWGGFEKLVADMHQTGAVSVEKNIVLTGKSGAPRQIDVLLIHQEGLYTHKTLVECKYWNTKITRQHIDAMAAAVEDLNAAKGVFFTTKGYQSGAIKVAQHKGIDIFIVREPKSEEWGLPGRIVDFYMQYFSRSVGNLQFEVTTSAASEQPSIALDLRLGDPSTMSFTPVLNKDGKQVGTLEQIIGETSMKALKHFTSEAFLLNGGEECTRYMKGSVNKPFDPPVSVIKDGMNISTSKLSYDLGIRVDQKRFIYDRSKPFEYALIVEDRVNRILYSATKKADEHLSSFKQFRPSVTTDCGDVMQNGSVLKIYVEPWFDFAELAGLQPIPWEVPKG